MPYLVADKYKAYTQIGTPYLKGNAQYIRTKHQCDHCNGSGYYANFGVCYKCEGSGSLIEEAKVYTEEEYEKYQASLARRRVKRAEEREQKEFQLISNSEINKKEKAEKLGFNPETMTTYIPLGNTYDIKETLKAEGYKYDPVIGWHGPVAAVPDVNHISFTFNELYNWYPLTKYAEFRPEAEQLVKDKALTAYPATGEFCGEIKERFHDYNVRLVDAREVCDGTCTLYKFETVNGKSTLIWVTSTKPKVKETMERPQIGNVYHLTATVKAHEISNGVKITKINRAIIKEQPQGYFSLFEK